MSSFTNILYFDTQIGPHIDSDRLTGVECLANS
jgi:hypothetical protein